ncbi:MAG: hypothetical protein M1817_000200 [Caeruleum heppii]|nr:MAG: hypothetical protein M1817_000200 [Caeruleum heppii]
MLTKALQFVSDLHLEKPRAYHLFIIDPQAPYLALLGDIGNTKDDGLFEFLQKQLLQFELVFFVLGNHEPYHEDWKTSKDRLRSCSAEIDRLRADRTAIGRFVFLDQDRFDVDETTTILGCPLYSNILPEQQEYVRLALNDFHYIEGWTIDLHLKLTSRIYATDPRHAKGLLTSGFATDLSHQECLRNERVAVWLFGHTHFNCDFVDPVSGTRLVTNQRGYSSDEAVGFEEIKVIAL